MIAAEFDKLFKPVSICTLGRYYHCEHAMIMYGKGGNSIKLAKGDYILRIDDIYYKVTSSLFNAMVLSTQNNNGGK